MEELKYSKVKLPVVNGSGTLRSPRRSWTRLYYNVCLIILVGVSFLMMMFCRESAEGSTGLIDDLKRMISPTVEELQQQWNYSSYSFRPNVSDWDEQRATWMEDHPHPKPVEGERPRVLMVTGSSPKASEHTILSHLKIRAAKNKLDYCQMHGMELFYNMGNPDPDFSDWWVKLPVIRMLMLQHPEVEWIWWLDADAVILDMSFEPPFAELVAERHNLVLAGEDRLVYSSRAWTGLSTANCIIRNCQWSLDLLDAWASMGTAGAREESGKFQSELLANRPFDFPGDDQSSLVALLAQDKRNPIGMQRWPPMVNLVKETEYAMSANWTAVAPKLEELSLDKHKSVPFVTHFAGCLPSRTSRLPLFSSQHLDACKEQLERAFDFADNQVYKKFGFLLRELGTSLLPLKQNRSEAAETGKDANEEKVYRLLPSITDWDERRLDFMEKNPPTKRDEVLLTSGAAPKPCAGKLGSHMLLRGLKNMIDYGRINDVPIFYNYAVIDEQLIGWWSKLPLLKILMLNNPGVEWIWWLDSDAVLTDMEYTLPFASFNASGYNVVMYGNEEQVYDQNSYKGINTGNFLIRNCQWSFDLLDRWGSFGYTEELRVANELLLLETLSDRPPGWDADDQSILVYLLVTERKKWGSKVRLENVIVMSGAWQYWNERFGDELMVQEDRPFMTHFAGCKPCQDTIAEDCLTAMDRTYNFADNEVLDIYGLRHEHLSSSELQKSSREVEDVEDLEAKEELEAANEQPVVDTANDEQVHPSTETDSTKSNEELVTSQEELGLANEEVGRNKEEKLEAFEGQKLPAKEEEAPKENKLQAAANEEDLEVPREKMLAVAKEDEFEVTEEMKMIVPEEEFEAPKEKKLTAAKEEEELEALEGTKLTAAAKEEDLEAPKEKKLTAAEGEELEALKEAKLPAAEDEAQLQAKEETLAEIEEIE